MPEIPVFMRCWRVLPLALLLSMGSLVPGAVQADSAQAPILWRVAPSGLWQLETTLRSSTPVTEVVSRILTVSAYAGRTEGQLSGEITRADGQRYRVELYERRVGIPQSVVTHSSLEITTVGPTRVDVRAVGGLYNGLHGSWHVHALSDTVALLRGAFELQPTQQLLNQPPFAAALQRQDPRPILEGWLQLWVQALGLTPP